MQIERRVAVLLTRNTHTRASRLKTRTRGLDSKPGLGLESQTRVQNESKNLVKLTLCLVVLMTLFTNCVAV